MFYQRYLLPYVQSDLEEKMVILAGPRQCGKTTLSQSITNSPFLYLNYDITQDRKRLLKEEFSDEKLWVFDEIQKMEKLPKGSI